MGEGCGCGRRGWVWEKGVGEGGVWEKGVGEVCDAV